MTTRRGWLRLPRLRLRYADGRVVEHSRWCLLPIVAFPLVFLGALLAEPHLRQHLRIVVADRAYAPIAWGIIRDFNRAALENLLFAKPVANESAIPTVHLDLPPSTLERMQWALLTGDHALGKEEGGDRPWFRAAYSWDGQPPCRVKIALRGVSQWHHRPEKPSFRIKIRKDDVRDGRRYVELQRPEDLLVLTNRIPDELAAEWGMLSDFGQVVRVFINRKYFGVYLATMRPGESLAIANGRMPGTFFKGDLVFGGDLWQTTEPWKVDGEALPEHFEHFQRFLDLLRAEPTTEVLDELATLLDFDTYAKWSAINIATGSVHTDAVHNHLYFLASNQGKIEAVVWDANSYGVQGHELAAVDLIKHPIADRLSRDPRWVQRRNEYLWSLIHGPLAEPAFTERVRSRVETYRRDIESDVNSSSLTALDVGLRTVPRSVRSIDDEITELTRYQRVRRELIADYLADARVAVRPAPGGGTEVQVAGTAAVICHGPPGERWLHPGLTEQLTPLEYHPNDVDYFSGESAEPVPMSFIVAGSADELTFTNAISGEVVRPGPWIADSRPCRTLRFPDPAPKPAEVVLGPGIVHLSSPLTIDSTQRLVVRPGTRLRMGPGVSIFSRGPVIARATEAEPIVIEPDPLEPWGAIGVSGPNTAGTVFAHVAVHGGGDARWVGLHFKGMLSVYDCPDVTLEDCRFGVNARGDDAVNLAESTVRVVRCEWYGARADGLDLDQCVGVVEKCRFQDTGNDGLDLMGCRLTIVDSVFVGCGDKGTSFGEGTTATATGCRYERCAVGIQLKDASRVRFERCTWSDNGIAIHAYQKKWIYGTGGYGAFVGCEILGSMEEDFHLDERTGVEWVGPVPSSGASVPPDRLRVVEKLSEEWTALGGEHHESKGRP